MIAIDDAEAFVRKILQENFNQKVDPETLRSVAEKVSRAIEGGKHYRSVCDSAQVRRSETTRRF